MKRKLMVLTLGIMANLFFGCDPKNLTAYRSHFMPNIGRVTEWPVYWPPVHGCPERGDEYVWVASEG